MTPEQGEGLQALKRLADDAVSRMPRDEARSFIDAIENAEFTKLLKVESAAGVAVDGESGGSLYFESAAARIDGLEKELAELRASRPFPALMTQDELMDVQRLPRPVVVKTLPGVEKVVGSDLGDGRYRIDLSKVKSRFVGIGFKDGAVVLTESDKLENTDGEKLRADTIRQSKRFSRRRR